MQDEMKQTPDQEEAKEEAVVETSEASVEEAPEEGTPKDPLEEANEKLAQTKDQLMRLMAEFDNYRKRTTKEKEMSFERGERNVVEAMLPVLDNFDLAIASYKDKDDPHLKGIQMTYDLMIKALNGLGVTCMDSLGKTFDPNFHEAMQRVEDEEKGEDEIVAVFRKGYMMNDTVLRAALVKVAN